MKKVIITLVALLISVGIHAQVYGLKIGDSYETTYVKLYNHFKINPHENDEALEYTNVRYLGELWDHLGFVFDEENKLKQILFVKMRSKNTNLIKLFNIRDKVYHKLLDEKGYISKTKKNILGYDSYILKYSDYFGIVSISNMENDRKVLSVLYSNAKDLEPSSEIDKEPIKESKESRIYDVAETMPSFPGGAATLMSYLNAQKKYPVVAEENGIHGRVVVSFVVERDGSITDVRVVRSVNPSLDREAQRVVSSMPKWIPGKQNGSAVRVRYNVPVSF